MRIHSQGFKEQIKELGREIDSRITYGDNTILAEQLFNVSPIVNGAILKSAMKELHFESSVQVPQYTVLKYEFGLKVNGEYEYLDYGNYIVNSVEYNEDTKTYKHTCYDNMLFSMKEYTVLQNGTFPMTVRQYLTNLCLDCGLVFKNLNNTFANYDKVIQSDLYANLGYTYRDIFDELSQVTASTICIDNNDMVEIRYINDTNDTIDAEYLKNINVTFGEKYGPINSIVLSRSAESDNVYLQDEKSIETNGLCELKIIDNQIMNDNNRSDYLPDILSKLNGLEYYLNDYTSTGVLYYELCDKYLVQIDDNIYSCIIFNDEPEITQGLIENIFTDKPTETKTDYIKADKIDRKINQAYLMVDKQNKKINALTSEVVENNEKVSQLEINVNEISTDINHKYDFLESDEGINQLDFDNSLEYQPVSFNIQGYTEHFEYLFPLEAKLKELHIEGKSEQETRTGRNLYNFEDIRNVTNGATADEDGWITISYDNSTGTSTVYANYYTNNLDLKTDTNYNIIMEVKEVSVNGASNIYPVSITGTTGGQFTTGNPYALSSLTNNTIKQFINTTKSSFENITDGLRTFVSFAAGVSGSITFRLSVLEDTTITTDTFKYEAFGASPSPDYPSEIKIIPSIRNLFDKDNTNFCTLVPTINGFVNNTLYRSIYIKIKPNTSYIISRKIYKDIMIAGTSVDIPISNGIVTNVIRESSLGVPIIITSGENDNYLTVYYNYENTQEVEVRNGLMIEEGTIKHDYVPYGAWAKFKIIGKNLLNTPYTENNKLTHTATKNDDYVVTDYYAELEAGKTYIFTCKTSGTFGLSGQQTQCFLMLNKGIDNLLAIDNKNKFVFTPPISGKYYLRYDVNINGETHSFWNFQIEEGTTSTEYEEYKEKEVLIDLSKPNLFDREKAIDGYYLNANTGELNSSEISSASDYIEVETGHTYTINYNYTENVPKRVCFYDESKTFISSVEETSTNSKYRFKVPSNAVYIRFQYRTVITDIKLYEGYTDYYELSSTEDTKDELSIIDRQVVIDKKIGKVVLDGSESSWSKDTSTGAYRLQLNGVIGSWYKKLEISTHWICDNTKAYNNINGYFAIASDGLLWVGSEQPTLAEFKTWLQTNPVTVYYELAEPQQIILPNTNIPLFDGINHITLVDDLETTITAVYNNLSNIETSLSGTNTVMITDCIERNLYPSDDLYPLGIIEGSCE